MAVLRRLKARFERILERLVVVEAASALWPVMRCGAPPLAGRLLARLARLGADPAPRLGGWHERRLGRTWASGPSWTVGRHLVEIDLRRAGGP